MARTSPPKNPRIPNNPAAVIKKAVEKKETEKKRLKRQVAEEKRVVEAKKMAQHLHTMAQKKAARHAKIAEKKEKSKQAAYQDALYDADEKKAASIKQQEQLHTKEKKNATIATAYAEMQTTEFQALEAEKLSAIAEAAAQVALTEARHSFKTLQETEKEDIQATEALRQAQKTLSTAERDLKKAESTETRAFAAISTSEIAAQKARTAANEAVIAHHTATEALHLAKEQLTTTDVLLQKISTFSSEAALTAALDGHTPHPNEPELTPSERNQCQAALKTPVNNKKDILLEHFSAKKTLHLQMQATAEKQIRVANVENKTLKASRLEETVIKKQQQHAHAQQKVLKAREALRTQQTIVERTTQEAAQKKAAVGTATVAFTTKQAQSTALKNEMQAMQQKANQLRTTAQAAQERYKNIAGSPAMKEDKKETAEKNQDLASLEQSGLYKGIASGVEKSFKDRQDIAGAGAAMVSDMASLATDTVAKTKFQSSTPVGLMSRGLSAAYNSIKGRFSSPPDSKSKISAPTSNALSALDSTVKDQKNTTTQPSIGPSAADSKEAGKKPGSTPDNEEEQSPHLGIQ